MAKKQTNPSYAHPAAEAYRDVTHYRVHHDWVDEVVETVSDDVMEIARWRACVRSWVGSGWSPKNLLGMLEKFREGTPFGLRHKEETQESAMAEWKKRGGTW